MSRRHPMIRRTGILFSILLSFMAPATFVSSESGHLTESTTPYGKVDWTTGIATARGIGIPPKNPVSPLQAKEMTRKAAHAVAQRNLLEVVKGVHIDSTTTINNFIMTNDEVQAKVQGFIHGSRLVKEQEMPDGSFETTVEMKIGGEFSKTVIPPTPSKDTPIYPKRPQNIPTSYTGLVVDARTLGAHPALAPRILNEQGEEAYSVAYVDRGNVPKDGILSYAPDPASAQSNQRVTNNPLVIKALRADGADLYIRDADAQTLHGVPAHFKFLKQAKVLVILDQQ